MNKTYIKTANLVLGYLALRFVELNKDEATIEKERALWASELESGIEAERITPENVKRACDLWADINADINKKAYPPTVDQFINCLKKVSFKPVKALEQKDKELDYLTLWNNADRIGKYKFFITHKYINVPPYIRLMFIEHMKANHGWTYDECKKMINYHMQPFNGAGHGAYVSYKREIIEYFKKRDFVSEAA